MANDHTYEVFAPPHGAPIKAWTRGVPVEEEAKKQLLNIAALPFIYRWIAVMPDVHLGKGATVGSVIPTTKAIIPAAVGVDIGCGMIAVRTPWSVDEVRARGSLAPLRGDVAEHDRQPRDVLELTARRVLEPHAAHPGPDRHAVGL